MVVCTKNQRMGIGSIMKRIAVVADLCGKRTARKTMVTTLTFKSKIPETQLAGHKNLQSLNHYKKQSLEQLK